MSHNVDRMFSVRDLPWHYDETKDRTTILEDYPQDWDEARKLAGLDWEPIANPVYTLAGVNDDGTGRYEELGDWKQVARSDTNTCLAITSDSYAIINHTAFGEIFEAVLEQDGNLKAETGGCLEGGRKVWMLVRLDEPIMLPGDTSAVMPYLALQSRHDAGGGVTLRATAVRIVCANTFGAAEMEGKRTGTQFTFRHTSGWRDRIEEARQAITGARADLQAYTALAADLLGIAVTSEQRELFITEFIPAPPAGLTSARVKNNIDRARASMRQIIASPTVTGAGIEGTAYGLVQAAGEYLDHVRKARTWETRLGRCILWQEPLKAKAVKLAREVAKA